MNTCNLCNKKVNHNEKLCFECYNQEIGKPFPFGMPTVRADFMERMGINKNCIN